MCCIFCFDKITPVTNLLLIFKLISFAFSKYLNALAVIGIDDKDVTLDKIKAKFKKIVKELHPDTVGENKNNTEKGLVMQQVDVERTQHFRKCIECYLCQNVCHVIRDQGAQDKFVGPRFMIRLASLEMHPMDDADRIPAIKDDYGSGMCNITRCCTEVCPEDIQITDDGIIPLKERVVDRYFDPFMILFRKIFKKE